MKAFVMWIWQAIGDPTPYIEMSHGELLLHVSVNDSLPVQTVDADHENGDPERYAVPPTLVMPYQALLSY